MGTKSFLQLVAEDLITKFGDDLSGVTVVFPNNRARLFFNNYLVRSSDKPIWSPAYTTIQELFSSCVPLQVADDMKLICDLFRAYSAHIDWNKLGVEPETMDDFYFWGEVILRDFDDVDNNLVPVELLFKNMVDLAKMEDDYSFLSEEQVASIHQFFHHFSVDESSLLKRKFMALWEALLPMYTDFREGLREQGIAYGGMLHRIVVDEVLKKRGVEDFPSEKYIFIGFNVLNKCEVELFSRLQKAGKALFYWDTDEYYMDMPDIRHEAATFMSLNLEKFPNQLPKSSLNTFKSVPKDFTIISSSTDTAQAKYLNDYLTDRKEKGDEDTETAVVLCDESLLLPVLHSVPPCVKDLNITMGLPLIQTPVYALVKVLLEMQCSVASLKVNSRSVPFRYIREVLSNPYVLTVFDGAKELNEEIIRKSLYFPPISLLKEGSDSLKLLFSFVDFTDEKGAMTLLKWLSAILKKVASFYRGTTDSDQSKEKEKTESALYDALYKEALYRSYTIVNRMLMLMETGDLSVSIQTLRKLLERMLSSVSVPFSGEPVKGMQVMGFLETRNLDFKNVVLLSVNEGVLPRTGGESSFIPHSLRKGFGMTTIEHKNSLYAYYFYRLLQRVENATFLYSTSTSGGSKGQMSRFLMQLLVETGIDVKLKDLRSTIEVALPQSFEVKNTEEAINILRKKYDKRTNPNARTLSPTMLKTYIKCPMSFYYSYVLELREPDEMEDGLDSRILGLILHSSLENIYRERQGRIIEPEELDALFDDKELLESVVDEAFHEVYYKENGVRVGKDEYTGQQLLLKMITLKYVENVLLYDKDCFAPFQIIGVEKDDITHDIEVDGMLFTMGGTIDRLQLDKDDRWRIIDYKTSSKGSSISISSISQLFLDGFSVESSSRNLQYALQVLLYAYVCTVEKGKNVVPSLSFVRSSESLVNLKNGKEEIEYLSAEMCAEIEDNIKGLLHSIFSGETFPQTSFRHHCTYCPFKGICGIKD